MEGQFDEARANAETDKIAELWNRFSAAESAEVQDIHPPIALHLMLEEIVGEGFTRTIQELPESHSRPATVEDLALTTVHMMNVMFRFGQYCAYWKFDYDKLLKCNCGKLDDTDLKNLLGGNDGQGDTSGGSV